MPSEPFAIHSEQGIGWKLSISGENLDCGWYRKEDSRAMEKQLNAAHNARVREALEGAADIADQHNSCEGIAEKIAVEIRRLKEKYT